MSVYRAVSFYVQAHQDDWQLFTGQQALVDLRNAKVNKTKVVFIYTTAGDSGDGSETNMNVREKGALASIKYVMDGENGLPDNISVTDFQIEKANINNHPVALYRYRNTESYFMRLPDGGWDSDPPQGTGNNGYRGQTLKKLRCGGSISSILSETSEFFTTYLDWFDFVNTLEQIILNATPSNLANSSARIYVADFDPGYRQEVMALPRIGKNCVGGSHDHSDHQETANAIFEFYKKGLNSGKFNIGRYLTYCNKNLPETITLENEQKETNLYLASGSQGAGASHTNDGWLGKNYLRHATSLLRLSCFDGSSWNTNYLNQFKLSDNISLTVFKQKLYYAFNSSLDENQLYFGSSKDGIVWSQARKVSNICILNSPSLASFQNRLYCVYQSNCGVEQLGYTYSSNGKDWAPGQHIKHVRILGSPILAGFGNKLYCLYKSNVEKYDVLAYTFTENGKDWSEEREIVNVRHSCSPALAVFGNKLYCVYKWSGGNRVTLAYTYYDGSDWANGQDIPQVQVGISGSPALAVLGNKLYCLYKWSECPDGNKLAFTCTDDGTNWSEGLVIDNFEAFSSPSTVNFKNKLFCINH